MTSRRPISAARYARAIERRWSEACGRAVVLSEREWALISAWFEKGVPLAVVENGAFDVWGSLRNVLLVGGVLAGLVYFFFSFEHKGFVGKTAKVGIWILMVTFGAAFGYTVMGRIALLAIRLEFLFDDWLWLIDPTDKRPGF